MVEGPCQWAWIHKPLMTVHFFLLFSFKRRKTFMDLTTTFDQPFHSQYLLVSVDAASGNSSSLSLQHDP